MRFGDVILEVRNCYCSKEVLLTKFSFCLKLPLLFYATCKFLERSDYSPEWLVRMHWMCNEINFILYQLMCYTGCPTKRGDRRCLENHSCYSIRKQKNLNQSGEKMFHENIFKFQKQTPGSVIDIVICDFNLVIFFRFKETCGGKDM